MLSSRQIPGLVTEARANTVKFIANTQVQQVRYRRVLAYPPYSKPGNIPPTRKGKKQTVFKRLMDQFLGPKNYKGEYYLNKYAYPFQNHTTNYIQPRQEQGNVLLASASEDSLDSTGDVGAGADDEQSRMRSQLMPFPMNRNLFTNRHVSEEMKQQSKLL
ncbi:unnamed protein product [Ambrosiozyma monospora]|uniref:Unnamed protein product n=1 Tax=Ambrosiozyma monospora TaxID=43982 RepID=A0ACB5TAJ6_AMBMO|nr:unnamed protein product [Ambrosiozyma monospora]